MQSSSLERRERGRREDGIGKGPDDSRGEKRAPSSLVLPLAGAHLPPAQYSMHAHHETTHSQLLTGNGRGVLRENAANREKHEIHYYTRRVYSGRLCFRSCD